MLFQRYLFYLYYWGWAVEGRTFGLVVLWLGFVVVFRRPLESGRVSLEEELFTEEELSVEEDS